MHSKRSKHLLVAFSTIVCLAMPTTSYAQASEKNRQDAALFEWVVANCKTEGVPGSAFVMVAMVINGSTTDEMTAARGAARTKAGAYPSKDAACLDLVARLKKANQ
ncbi:hypothetical protein [Agrobacterium sp. SUL3]|uniref:hypothetical protein n=1 Tax=Agrobacterium sp. SUL3 TaxID=1701910 RepID=UPI00069C89E6|nr:hypothetical protein [Agrobacterium sp. SUL3]KNY35669.1 hypothetical protein AKG12_01140 [Agrobacterium sp. SUL3]